MDIFRVYFIGASSQLQAAGNTVRMGQRIQLLYAKTEEGVHAWDLPNECNPALIDVPRYRELIFRAVYEVLQPMGIAKNVLRDWMFSEASYLVLTGWANSIRLQKSELPLFASLKYLSAQ